VTTPAELDYLGRDFVNFRDGTYRWVHLKNFGLPSEIRTPADGLASLLRHVRYRDHYTTDDEHWEDSETLHGPYRLDRISAESYDAIDAEDALRIVREFAELHGGTTEQVLAELDRVVNPAIRESSTVYRLRDLGEEAKHDFGWVLTDFNELVLVDLPARRLALLVAAGD